MKIFTLLAAYKNIVFVFIDLGKESGILLLFPIIRRDGIILVLYVLEGGLLYFDNPIILPFL